MKIIGSLCFFSFKFIFDLLCFIEQVLITEQQKSFSHFITNVCAIIGGVFTVCISDTVALYFYLYTELWLYTCTVHYLFG
jgi:hypothetical protein